MRTGIKTLLRKTNRGLRRTSALLYQREPAKFPKRGAGNIRIRARIQAVAKEIKGYKLEQSIGGFHSKPHEMAVEATERLVSLNPNNLGNWSLNEQQDLQGTRQIERELIQMMIDLYGGKASQWGGYVTGGGSESNLFSAWLGRKYLEKHTDKQNICLIKTSLTHYSIEKSADIIGVPGFTTALHPQTWSMDSHEAEQTITILHKKGFRGFLVPLTIGYTQTGTNDDLQTISRRLKRLEKKLGIKFFLWTDAALSGLVLPFNTTGFRPLSNLSLQTFLVDFHKFGLTPIPSGIVLYRQRLRKLIERKIPYLEEEDNTVSGSRSGIPSVACWTVIHSLGRQGFQEIVSSCINQKKRITNSLKEFSEAVQIVTDEHAINAGLILRKGVLLPESLSKHYGLRIDRIKILFTGGKERIVNLAKLIFMPYITSSTIQNISKELLQHK